MALKIVAEELPEKANILANDSKGSSILHYASMVPHGAEIISYGIEKGLSVNKANTRKVTPLMIASIFGHSSLLETMVSEHKSEVNVQSLDRASALHYACTWGHYFIAKILIDYGARLNTQDRGGRTPLHLACLYNQLECARILIHSKCEVNLHDSLGRTPLINAVILGNRSIVELLLKARCSVNVKDKTGMHFLAFLQIEKLFETHWLT